MISSGAENKWPVLKNDQEHRLQLPQIPWSNVEVASWSFIVTKQRKSWMKRLLKYDGGNIREVILVNQRSLSCRPWMLCE